MATLKSAVNELIDDIELKRAKTEAGGYDEKISSLVDDLYGNATGTFSYDAETDPEYQAAVKDYGREADRTMRDTLAQGAAKTGGIASTAAVTAASQARDYTMSGLADVKANLYNQALERNTAEANAKYQILSVLENLSEEEQDNYLSLLSMEKELADEEKTSAQEELANRLALGLAPTDELISASGWGNDYVGALEKAAVLSMDTAQVQQYLNSKGAGLTVDGSWGPKTEAAYQQIFGEASGKYTGYTPGYTPTADPTDQTVTFDTIAQDVQTISGRENRTAFIRELYSDGKITKEAMNKLIAQYARN